MIKPLAPAGFYPRFKLADQNTRVVPGFCPGVMVSDDLEQVAGLSEPLFSISVWTPFISGSVY